MKTVGEIIDMHLKMLELSQADLSQLSGVSNTTISSLVMGRAELSVPIAFKIAKALRSISARDLLTVQLNRKIYEHELKQESPVSVV